MTFCGKKSFTENHFQMEMIFLAQEMIISKTYEIIFVALLEMKSWKWFVQNVEVTVVGNDFFILRK